MCSKRHMRVFSPYVRTVDRHYRDYSSITNIFHLISPFMTQVHMSHGGLTSSSAYGSGRGEDCSSDNASNKDPHHQGFGGFGGTFGERSLLGGGSRSGASKGRARMSGGGGLPPGYAPSSGGGVEAALSSNAFASGHSQNCGNVMTGRPSSRVTAPPGGHSTFSLS